MVPITLAVPASIPFPIDMSPGLAPVLVLAVFAICGTVAVIRAATCERRTPGAQRLRSVRPLQTPQPIDQLLAA